MSSLESGSKQVIYDDKIHIWDLEDGVRLEDRFRVMLYLSSSSYLYIYIYII